VSLREYEAQRNVTNVLYDLTPRDPAGTSRRRDRELLWPDGRWKTLAELPTKYERKLNPELAQTIKLLRT
jgi:hypothetical protein